MINGSFEGCQAFNNLPSLQSKQENHLTSERGKEIYNILLACYFKLLASNLIRVAMLKEKEINKAS